MMHRSIWRQLACLVAFMIAFTIASLAFFPLTSFADSTPARTIVSRTEIPVECQADYQVGLHAIHELIERPAGLRDPAEYGPQLDAQAGERSDSELCRFFWSMGALDGMQVYQQQIIWEWFLELNEFPGHAEDPRAKALWRDFYQDRFAHAGIDPTPVMEVAANWNSLAERLDEFTNQQKRLADTEQRAVPWGRFVFLGKDLPVHSLYRYQFTAGGAGQVELVFDDHNNPVLKVGSWQDAAIDHYNRAYQIADGYMHWEPGLFYGQDSFFHGAFWRAIGWDKSPSLREQMEESAFRGMTQIRSSLRRMRLSERVVLSLEGAMVKKQRAVLENEIAAYNRTERALWAAPLIPLGMYGGGILLAHSGWFTAIPASTASFSYVGGSVSSTFAVAQNVAAATSLLAISGYSGLGAYAAVKDWYESDDKSPYKISRAFDRIVHAGVNSFPLAAIAPVQVGAAVLGGKQLWMGGRWLLAQGVELGQVAAQAGVRGSLHQLGRLAWKLPGQTIRLPGKFVKQVIMAWWRQPKLLAIHYATDIAITGVFDVGYRQVFLDGEDKFIYVGSDGKRHVNQQAVYSIIGTVVVSPLAKPIILIESFAGRWMAFRSLSLVSGVAMQLAVSGSVDTRRLTFDQAYASTISTGLGELDRAIKLSSLVQSQPAHRQFALLLLIKALVMKPIENPIKIYLQDRYIRGEIRPVDEFRRMVLDSLKFDLEGFSDDEIEAALQTSWDQGIADKY